MSDCIQGLESLEHPNQEVVVGFRILARSFKRRDTATVDSANGEQHKKVRIHQEAGANDRLPGRRRRAHCDATSRNFTASNSPVSTSIRKRLYCKESAASCAKPVSWLTSRGRLSVMFQTSRPLYVSLSISSRLDEAWLSMSAAPCLAT